MPWRRGGVKPFIRAPFVQVHGRSRQQLNLLRYA